MMPSSQPSMQPSLIPSNIPSPGSDKPSLSPSSSVEPTETSQPSNEPSSTLSEEPSSSPSFNPSNVPTTSSFPSSKPSLKPSNMPSESFQPSPLMSTNPSSKPSESSSPTHEYFPSSEPSMMPSSHPSMQPSLTPSNRPSMDGDVPSVAPTLSMVPSMLPSISHSPSESQKPSPLASHHPSSMPSESHPPTDGIFLSFIQSWTGGNFLTLYYQVERNVAHGGLLLQSDCATPITDTNIISYPPSTWWPWPYTSPYDNSYFYYNLDPATIYNSVIFDSATSKIEVCHVASITNNPNIFDAKIITIIVPSPGTASGIFGDPHIVTFDEMHFDCQAAGEFTTLKSLENSNFKIQERFTATESGACAQASVSTGVAVVDVGKPIIQISTPRTSTQASSSLNTFNGCPIDFYVDGSARQLDADLSGIDASISVSAYEDEDTIKIKHDDTLLTLNVTVAKSTSLGCHIMVQVTLPGLFRSGETLLGLLGTPNGDRNDDWRASDGAILSPPVDDMERMFSTAYNYCTQNWCVQDSSESLFVYGTDESFENINKCDEPFSSELEDAVAEIVADSSVNPDLSNICQGNLVCLVDGLCGDIEDAQAALENEQSIIETQVEVKTSLFSPEEVEAEAQEPETIPESPEPSLAPSSTPSKSFEPTLTPSGHSSLSPSVSLTPSESSDNIPVTVPSPTDAPVAQPSTGKQSVTIPGSISTSVDICVLSQNVREQFSNAVVQAISGVLLSSFNNNSIVKIASVCGVGSGRRSLSSRNLQTQSWQIEYEVTQTFTCEVASCSSPADAARLSTIANQVSTSVNDSLTSGQFAVMLRANISPSSGINQTILDCLVVWGTISEARTEVDGPRTGVFYPDWQYQSGTCLEDGNEPLYMKKNDVWLFSSLEGCCSRFYSGWNFNKCMNVRGSGLWFVDHMNEKCVTDCKDENGGTCGGLANPLSDRLYSDPKSCCESELAYRFKDLCEAESLQSNCYAGTGKFYSGGVGGGEYCVRDCDPASGDSTCGGLVEESYVMLHDSAEACCRAEYQWIDVELCTVRSNQTRLEKYWPDKTNSKCYKDSENPTVDLSVQIFDTASECCKVGIFWLSENECLSASGVTPEVTAGSSKFYVDWERMKCVKDCEGAAPCGGFAHWWEYLYGSASACCVKLPQYDSVEECVFA